MPNVQIELTEENESRLAAIVKESNESLHITGLANMMLNGWMNSATNRAVLNKLYGKSTRAISTRRKTVREA